MQKQALVTGASQGIGRAFADRLVREGYRVVCVARNEAKLREWQTGAGPGHSFLVADLSTADGQARVVDALRAERFHLLVNNAGVGTLGGFLDTPVEVQTAMVRLNCEALVALSYAFLAQAESGDALVNISSVLAFAPLPRLGLYSGTKSLVTAFSEALWFEQKARGVYVLGLCPGITDTGFRSNAGAASDQSLRGAGQTPEQVVETTMRALARRKAPTVVSGGTNRLAAIALRLLPRRIAVSLMGRAAY